MNNNPGNGGKAPQIPPDCFRCQHFKITWDPAFPRACLIFGMKCRNLPSMEVFISTGKHCIAFQAKAGQETKN